MANKSKRFLGELDAASDQLFQRHFVPSRNLSRINDTASDIIYGAKGVGKTALRRALTELNTESFSSTTTIDLDELSFERVHSALEDLNRASKADLPTLARNMWRNTLALYGLEAIADSLNERDELQQKIASVLSDDGFVGTGSSNRLLGYIERLLEKIGALGLEHLKRPDAVTPPLGLTRTQRSLIDEFPSNPIVLELFAECSTRTQSAAKPVLVCIDGFDSIVAHREESRTAIFAGLIDAVRKSSVDPTVSRLFCYKAFLPLELTGTAHKLVWDRDKYIFHTHHLRWSKEDFQEFLVRRLSHYAKGKSGRFEDVWLEFMPDTLRNGPHHIDEKSFEYILRHTLYRPRQLLTHVQNILNKWDEEHDAFRVDPTFIRRVVAETNYELADNVVSELSIPYEGLDIFMRSWSGMPNVMPAGVFKERLRKYLVGGRGIEDPTQRTVEETKIFNELFKFGIFGIELTNRVKRGGKTAPFRFGFVGDLPAPNIHATVDDGELLAFAPMFNEYCGCSPAEYGAVIPVPMNAGSLL